MQIPGHKVHNLDAMKDGKYAPSKAKDERVRPEDPRARGHGYRRVAGGRVVRAQPPVRSPLQKAGRPWAAEVDGAGSIGHF